MIRMSSCGTFPGKGRRPPALGLLSENSPAVLAVAATVDQAGQAWKAGAQTSLGRNASPEALAAALFALSHGLQVTDPALSGDAGQSQSGSKPALR